MFFFSEKVIKKRRSEPQAARIAAASGLQARIRASWQGQTRCAQGGILGKRLRQRAEPYRWGNERGLISVVEAVIGDTV